MATKTKSAPKFDATRPFYAAVGAGDLAVAFARTAATDVQASLAKVELEPQAIRAQASTLVSTRVEGFQGDAKKAQAALESRFAAVQADAKALPTKLEKLVTDYLGELAKGYTDLAVRGEGFVAKVRKQEATQETVAAAKTTVTKAKTTKTQAKKAAKKTTKSTTSSAKATSTAAKKTASAATKAAADAADKAGA
ncbi:MAG: hypothetical protein WBQ50_08185 [Nocardioides sp.]